MAQHTHRSRLALIATSVGVMAPLVLAGSAGASTSARPGAPTVHGTIHGFATNDFLYVDGLSTSKVNVAQVSLAQSATGVANNGLTTKDNIGQHLLTGSAASGHQAYARGAGAGVNLLQANYTNPQVQLVDAEAVSAPPHSKTTKQLLNLPLGALANVDVQPDTAESNLPANGDFCVLGKPISQGTGTVTNASVLQVAPLNLVSADGTVKSTSTEELDPNGHGSLGLTSVATMSAAGIKLLNGLITVKLINPLVLDAFAGGVKGTAKTLYGSGDGKKDLLAITIAGQTEKLSFDDIVGGKGLSLHIGGLADIEIGAAPTIKHSANGQIASISGDLVKVKILGNTPTGTTTVGGLLGALQPVLNTLTTALKNVGNSLANLLSTLGLTTAADIRVGHFEATSQVPNGGIKCQIPVKKTSNKNPVTAGDNFTVTISAKNPYACTIKNVKVVDKITGTDGLKWTVGDTRPKANHKTNTEVVWNNIGNISPGGSKQVQVDIAIDSDSASGTMKDTSTMTGKCATGNATGTSNVNLAGKFTLHGPRINPSSSPGPGLPNTGMDPWLPVGGGLVLMTGIGLAVARRRGTV
jgi:LPXTG-motif cell wall-anchored protein